MFSLSSWISKKSCPIFDEFLLCKNGQDFLDILYFFIISFLIYTRKKIVLVALKVSTLDFIQLIWVIIISILRKLCLCVCDICLCVNNLCAKFILQQKKRKKICHTALPGLYPTWKLYLYQMYELSEQGERDEKESKAGANISTVRRVSTVYPSLTPSI